MLPKTTKLLWDLVDVAEFLTADTEGSGCTSYANERRLRLSVERSIQTLGEIMVRLEREDIETCQRIDEYQSVIGLRNRLAHRYGTDISDTIIWEAATRYVPNLLIDVRALLDSPP